MLVLGFIKYSMMYNTDIIQNTYIFCNVGIKKKFQSLDLIHFSGAL